MVKPTVRSRRARKAAEESRRRRAQRLAENFDGEMGIAEIHNDQDDDVQSRASIINEHQSPLDEIDANSDDEIGMTDGEDEGPTGNQWEGILHVMAPSAESSIKYSRGPSEHRMTTWRHKKEKEQLDASAKNCANITSFFQVRKL